MGDATKIGRFGQVLDDPALLRNGRNMLRRGAGEAAEGGVSLRSAVGGVDDLVVAMGPSALGGPQIYNPALIPDAKDIDSAQDAGRAAGKRLKKNGNNLAGAAVVAGTVAESAIAGQQPATAPKTDFVPIGQESAAFKAATPVVDIVEKASSVAGIGMMGVEMGLPLLGGAVGLFGKAGQKAKAVLNKPNLYLNPQAQVDAGHMTTGGHINNAMMAGFSVISTFGVAKGFSAGLDSLKHMNEAITGVPANKVSAMTLLTSNNLPDVVLQARRHLLQEHLSRGAVNVLSLGLIGRSIMRKKAMGMAEFLIPMGIGMGVDMMMGESALPFFAGVSNAHKAGEKIPAQAYAEFIVASSSDIKRRGPIGMRAARLIGEEAAAQQVAPGVLLAEIEASLQAHKHGKKGAFDLRIDRAIEKGEMMKAGHGHAAQAPQAAISHQPQAAMAQPEPTMVDRIGAGGKPRDIAVQGRFTKQLKQEIASPDISAGGRVTGP